MIQCCSGKLDLSMASYKGFSTVAEGFRGSPVEKGGRPSRLVQLIDPHIERELNAFYEKLKADPALSDILAKGPGVETLKTAQAAHWRILLKGELTEELKERGRRIGAAHVRAGLKPNYYIHVYRHFFQAFTKILLGRRDEDIQNMIALSEAIFTDMDLALSAYGEISEKDARQQNALSMVQSVEEEVSRANATGKKQADELTAIIAELARSVDDLRKGVDLVERGSNASRNGIQSVAAAVEEMHASSREVGQQADDTSRMATTAVQKADEAGRRMQKLTESASRVAEIVKLIANISNQTNLLALNATIEAARAGEAGRGFAVVASEVKQLSQRTAAATKEISAQIQDIEEATRAASVAMIEVGAIIDGMNKMAGGVAETASSQIAALQEISASANAAAGGADDLSKSTHLFTAGVAEVDKVATNVQDYGAQVSSMMTNLTDRLIITVRGFAGVDGRRHVRAPIRVQVYYQAENIKESTETIELSEGGCLLKMAGHRPEPKNSIILDIPRVGSVRGTVAGYQPLGMRVEFCDLTEAQRTSLSGLVEEAQADDAKVIEIIAKRRDAVQGSLSEAIRTGQISMADLFSTEYQQVSGTNPPQFTTKSLSLLEKLLPEPQESALQVDSRIVFCIAVDRNGYIPVHNRKFSQPQGQDPVWNDANARNRRIFDDRAGLAAARNLKEVLVQTYPRQFGGQTIMMKDISMPITIEGRHWGALRAGVSVK
jgi:methyl-accepting chemotaxis protein